jgi:HTH-type transcriptional regulator, cell division transcriptional repressor
MTQARKNIIGARVKLARLRQKPLLTQDGLSGRVAAAGVHLDRAAISKIESGSRYVLDYELKAIAKALGVSIAWLLDTED